MTLYVPRQGSVRADGTGAATPQETGAGLLRAIAAAGVWIEQEAVASEVLR
jgi:hypothetical protein